MHLHSTVSVNNAEDLSPQNSPISLNIPGDSSSSTLAVADSEETSSNPIPGCSTSATSTQKVTKSNRPKQKFLFWIPEQKLLLQILVPVIWYVNYCGKIVNGKIVAKYCL